MTSDRGEIKGLDTLRFVAAITVALGHGAAFPVIKEIGKNSLWAKALTGLLGVSFDGVAAVILFFVISGFCIHYGPASGAPFKARAFWVRRGIRIGGPLIGAIAIAHILGGHEEAALGAVLWSVYCEVVYYAIYPFLRVVINRIGLQKLTICSTILSISIVLFHWKLPYYWSFTIWFAWLVALPASLLGCCLAESVAKTELGPAANPPWGLRSVTWIYATLALAFSFMDRRGSGYRCFCSHFSS